MGERYSRVAIAFHWTIALLVIVNLFIGLGEESIAFLDGSIPLHKSIGITVLVLTIGRVAWRLTHRPPALPADIAPWERGVAHATQWALYALLVVMPLSGWAMSSNPERRRPLNWFGTVDIPYLPVSPGGARLGHDAHEILGWLMLALVVLHVAAALRHHFLLRDNVLARMLPGGH